MPTYEYRCLTCGHEFEFFQSMSEAPLAHCPHAECPLEEAKKGTGTVERRISAGTGLVFKGSGFYITDYKGSTPPPKRDSGSSKKDEGGSSKKDDGGSSKSGDSAPGSAPAPAPSKE